MNKQHRANLETLAAFLETEPGVRKHFNMASFLGVADDCSTTACAMGWAPVALGDWKELQEPIGIADELELFHPLGIKYFGLDTGDPRWDWIFSSEWDQIDNTPEGAAKRIRHFLANGCKLRDEEQDIVELLNNNQEEAERHYRDLML